ncbi:MAG: hypothetical protein R3C32_10575 [Chloroflexota bacterium]
MLPERFDLSYIDDTGQPQRPMAIHRAIYGLRWSGSSASSSSTSGAFLLWCAPVQAVVVPIADRHNDAARELAGVLRPRPAGGGR